MKRILCLTLVICMALSLAACATSPAPSGSGTAEPVKMGRAEYAAHGTKCFTVAVVAMQGDKIVGASLDDYQFMGTDVATGVPNSDKDFGQNYADPTKVLASKRANADYYSEHMAEEAKATKRLDTSWDEIQQFVVGKTIAELEDTLSKNDNTQILDVVSGATLVDTHGYLEAIVAAAKNAK